MKAHALLLFAALGTAAALMPRDVQASPLRLPATIYPHGAHITYRPVLTNAEMDCLWGFSCEGDVPLFHVQTQNQLHRLGGWGQFAGVQHHGRTAMAFELFVSRYDPMPDETGTPWSEQALLDLEIALRGQGYRFDGRTTALLPAMREGDTLVAVQQLGKQDLVVMAFCSGSLEIEGIALYDHRPLTAGKTAWASLARQIRLASRRGA